jgi:hypothetical protein
MNSKFFNDDDNESLTEEGIKVLDKAHYQIKSLLREIVDRGLSIREAEYMVGQALAETAVEMRLNKF